MEAVFLRLLNMSLTASILAAVVMVLRLGLKKAPRWIHCLLWAMVALRLILPFSFESPTSLLRDTQIITPDAVIPGGIQISTDFPAVDEQINIPLPQQGTTSSVPAGATVDIMSVLIVLWVAGMAFMAAYSLLSYLRLRRQVAPSLALTGDIYLCDYIETPFILGIVRPRIYLPTAMDPSAAAHVLAHERAHLRRLDHWWKPLGFALLTVHWFNPVIWVAYILLCRDIELACDEKVIKEMGCADKRAYSEALLRCSVPRRMIAACPLAFGEVGVKERVKNVMKFKKPAIWIILAAVVVCIIVAVCFLTDPMDDTEDTAGTTLAEFQGVSDDDVLSVTLSYISSYVLDEQSGQMQEQSRFLYPGYISRVLAFLDSARIDPEPVSQDRSDDRYKHYGITLQNGSTELSYWFNSEFSEVWIDDGVKPSHSYQMEDPEAARTLFQSMLTEWSRAVLPFQGTTYIASGSQSTAFDGTVLDVNKDYLDVSTGMLYDSSAQPSFSSSRDKVVRVYWNESGMQFLPGDKVHILGYSISDDPLETPVFRAYSIELLKPILPASIHMEIARELRTANFTCFDAVQTYQHTDSRLKTSFVVGIRYGDRYALGYYSNDSDGAVFERLVTADQLEPTGIDGVFRDPTVPTDEYSIYLRTEPIRYYMVPRYDADGVGQLHITDNQPAIHIRYANEGSISNHFIYGHNVVYEIFPQYVSYSGKWSGISLALPESWEYEIRQPETENGSFSIAFRPAGADGWVVVQYTPDSFVPAGEAQKTEDLPVSSYWHGATMAYCDGSDVWSYIQFHAPYDNYAVVNEGADWLAIYYGETALRILRTLTLT